jgi:hypothetical protein
MITTISYDQDEILWNILKMHVKAPTFDLDPCFGGGRFYSKIIKPPKRFDIDPCDDSVKAADCTNLPLEDGSVSSVIFDPPFVCGHQKKGKTGIIKSRFSSFRKVPELWDFYYASMQEFHRVLAPGGWLVFKCQDTVEDHKNFFSHCEIMNMALDLGYYPKDLFVLVAKNRIKRANQKNQVHARKYHCYFWVFQKAACKVKYGERNMSTTKPTHKRDDE